MRLYIPLFFFALLALSACKKEAAPVSTECSNPLIYDKFDHARELVIGTMDTRLADFATLGHCDTCFSAELAEANATIYSAGELFHRGATCYDVFRSYQSYGYKMIGGAQTVPMATDSAKFAALKSSYQARFGQILNYIQSLQ